jgi:acetoin utilization deacetylase AcuC-like enzyme
MPSGYVYDPIFLQHDLRGHPENAQRLVRIVRLLEETGALARLTQVPARDITAAELAWNHTPDYVAQVRRMAERGGGHLDMDTYVAAGSYAAALQAAGGLIDLTAAVLEGRLDNGFALLRPPGHHALRNRGMGFCLFNNVALAAYAALETHGLERVLIVDFDVHHGNGTQDSFDADPRVLYLSTHQYPHYPGTGHWQEMGQGKGQGATANVPLSPGVGDAGFALIFEDFLWPLAERYRPQLILVSAGYDAHWSDPLAGMALSIAGYATLARSLKSLAETLCSGRLVFTLEGGYNLDVLSYAVLNTFKVLLGDDDVVDPLGPSPHSERSVDELVARLKETHGLA